MNDRTTRLPDLALDEAAHAEADDRVSHEHAHGPSFRLATFTLLALLALTGLTVLGAQLEVSGALHIVIALAIAIAKTTLVVSVFMHLLYDKGMTHVVVGSCIFGLFLFIGLTLADLGNRGSIDRAEFTILAPPTVTFEAMINVPEVQRGREYFGKVCASCHGPGGRGLPGLGKDMTKSQFIRGLDDRQLLRFIKQGRLPGEPLNTTGVAMPPRGGDPTLTDEKLEEIIKFVRILAPHEAGGMH